EDRVGPEMGGDLFGEPGAEVDHRAGPEDVGGGIGVGGRLGAHAPLPDGGGSGVGGRLGAHAPRPDAGRSYRVSHAFAWRQSSLTVLGETSSTCAISSTERPPKRRSSATLSWRGLRWASD